MKLILVASMAVGHVLGHLGALGRHDQERAGRCAGTGAYSSRSRSPTSGRRTPTTTRSGLLKSSIAAPSLRNSGLLATSNGDVGHLGHPARELGVGADRHGALDDDHLGAVEVPGDLLADRPDAADAGSGTPASANPAARRTQLSQRPHGPLAARVVAAVRERVVEAERRCRG